MENILEVKVVYVDPVDPVYGTDFVTRVAPLEADLNALDALPKEGVLFIVISTEWGNRAAMVDRMWSNYGQRAWHGEDNYVIGVVRGKVKWYPEPVDLFFTEAYDDGDNRLRCRALQDPHQLSRLSIEKAPRYPPETRYVTLRGAWIDSELWRDVATPLFEKLY